MSYIWISTVYACQKEICSLIATELTRRQLTRKKSPFATHKHCNRWSHTYTIYQSSSHKQQEEFCSSQGQQLEAQRANDIFHTQPPKEGRGVSGGPGTARFYSPFQWKAFIAYLPGGTTHCICGGNEGEVCLEEKGAGGIRKGWYVDEGANCSGLKHLQTKISIIMLIETCLLELSFPPTLALCPVRLLCSQLANVSFV